MAHRRAHYGIPESTRWHTGEHTMAHRRAHYGTPESTLWHTGEHTMAHRRAHYGTPESTLWHTGEHQTRGDGAPEGSRRSRTRLTAVYGAAAPRSSPARLVATAVRRSI